MRLAIIGQQLFGASVLEAFVDRGDEVAGVFCAPEKPGAKPDPLRLAARARGLDVFQFPSLKGEAAAAALRGLAVDIGVMAYVLQFAPQTFVNIPRCGTIQYHPSLLPAYRGPSSINWPIIKGDAFTGVSIFRPTDGLDEGPVILQKTVRIEPHDTVGSIYFDRLFPQGVAAMLEAANQVVAGRHEQVAQDESAASYEGWCRDAEAEIHWHDHVDHLYRLIRGCNPMPGAWTIVQGEKLRIFDVKKRRAARLADVVGKPGEICAIGESGVQITVQGGRLDILKVRVEGGEKMPAQQFAAAAGLQVGDLFAGEAARRTTVRKRAV